MEMGFVTKENLELARSRHKEGTTAYSHHNYWKAVKCYSEALALIGCFTNSQHIAQGHLDRRESNTFPDTDQDVVLDTDDFCRLVLGDRAKTCMRLDHYEHALADAVAALNPYGGLFGAELERNWQVIVRAGRAQYHLGNFRLAHGHLTHACSISEGSEGQIATLVEATEKRIREEDHGEFDFYAMSRVVTKYNTRLNLASFLRNTRVGPSGNRGRGLFATKDLAPGDVILVERAFHVAFTQDEGGDDNEAKLLNGIIEKLR